MSYAIRHDGLGWRAVDSPSDCSQDEYYSAEQPNLTQYTAHEAIPALDALLALDAAGLSSAYDAWANSPTRTFAERAFIAKAQTWRRDDPTLNAAAAALGLSESEVDALFAGA